MIDTKTLKKPYKTEELIGHIDAQKQLYKLFKSDLTRNSIILKGLKGIGKSTLAFKFALYAQQNTFDNTDKINFTNFNSSEYSRDIDLLISGGHPNIIYVHPYMFEDDNVRGDIKIDHIRWLKSKLTGTIINKYMRVCIIDSIDDANISACNSLLKMIEEPPINTLFLLINHDTNSVIKTIKSRCMTINLDIPDYNDIEKIIKTHVSDFNINKFLDIMKYKISPGIILNLLENDVFEINANLNKTLNNMPYINTDNIIKISDNLSKKINEEKFYITVELLFLWVNKKVHKLIELDINKLIIYKWTNCWSENSLKYRSLKDLNLNKEHYILNFLQDVNNLMQIELK